MREGCRGLTGSEPRREREREIVNRFGAHHDTGLGPADWGGKLPAGLGQTATTTNNKAETVRRVKLASTGQNQQRNSEEPVNQATPPRLLTSPQPEIMPEGGLISDVITSSGFRQCKHENHGPTIWHQLLCNFAIHLMVNGQA